MLFVDAVKFQGGWYHGLCMNYQARPDICSGRAFCLRTGCDQGGEVWGLGRAGATQASPPNPTLPPPLRDQVERGKIRHLVCQVTNETLIVNTTKGVKEHDKQQLVLRIIVSNR